MSNLVRNERTKLLANALDRASTACLAVGILAPLSSSLLGAGPTRSIGGLLLSFVGWTATAVVLHLGARRLLGDLVVTTQWLIFSTVMPAVVAGIGWLAHEWQLRRELDRETRSKAPAE